MRVMSAYNFFVGTAVAVAMELFDQYGAVLGSFLMLNLIDWITGTCKARFLKTESSVDLSPYPSSAVQVSVLRPTLA